MHEFVRATELVWNNIPNVVAGKSICPAFGTELVGKALIDDGLWQKLCDFRSV